MMGLAILIFIMVFGMLYVAFRNQEDKANANENVVAGDSVTLIRPMIFCRESEIRSAAARLKLPVIKSRCPADGCTARADAQKTICLLEKTYPALTERIITALQEGNVSGWGFPGEA